MKFSDIKDFAIIAAVGYLIYLIVKNRDKFDPTSDQNVAYTSASGFVNWLSGGQYQTVGDWLFGTFGDDSLDPIRFSPVTLPDGTKTSRVTRVVNLRTNLVYDVNWNGNIPTLVRAAS